MDRRNGRQTRRNQRFTIGILSGALGLAGVSLPVSRAAQAPAPAAAAGALLMDAERFDDRIVVRVQGETFTSYRFGPGQKYPYFYPVNGPASGVSVTTESSQPYPHHRSLFFGCDKVNGGNYWQEGNETGQIVSKGATISRNGPDSVHIRDECEWRKPGSAAIVSDRRDIRITAPRAGLRIIDFRIVLTALTDVTVQRTNHSLFAARVDPALSVKSGGVLRNAEGALAEKGTYGAASQWCDYSGKRCGVIEGIAIFDSPRNPWFPSRWFTRDYGFFSPTSLQWLGDEGQRLPAGERVELTYRVVVHTGDAAQAGLEALFQSWKTNY